MVWGILAIVVIAGIAVAFAYRAGKTKANVEHVERVKEAQEDHGEWVADHVDKVEEAGSDDGSVDFSAW